MISHVNLWPGKAPIIKVDGNSVSQSPKTEIEDDLMKKILHVHLLLYAQVCTRLDSVYAISGIGRLQSSSIVYWEAAKNMLRYFQCVQISLMVIPQNSVDLCAIENMDFDFDGCHEIYFCYVFTYLVVPLLEKVLFRIFRMIWSHNSSCLVEEYFLELHDDKSISE